jgi:hypothetical protein
LRQGIVALISGVVAISCLAQPAYASAWTRAQREAFVETRADYFRADLSGGGLFERLENTTYVEFGLTDSLMMGGKAHFGESWIARPTGSSRSRGVTEYEGFIQKRIFGDDTHVLSARLAAARPTRFEAGGRPGLSADGADIDARILYGRNLQLEPFKIFASAETAFRKRLGDGADQVRLDGTIGIEPLPRILILGEALTTLSLRNNEPLGADYDVLRLQPSIVFRINRRWGLRAGAGFEVLSRNLDPGTTYFIGLWTGF